MKLQDRLPEHVTVHGHRYKLDLDYRNVLQLIDTLARDDLTPEAREWLALKCVMKRPRHVQETMTAVRALLFPDAQKSADKQKITDFTQDANLIRAAFMQTYRINLYRDRLHWYEFQALLAGLPEGSRYTDVLGIRMRPMPKPTKYNSEERAWLAKAKAELAVHMTEEERERSLNNSLRGVAESLLALAGKGGETHG